MLFVDEILTSLSRIELITRERRNVVKTDVSKEATNNDTVIQLLPVLGSTNLTSKLWVPLSFGVGIEDSWSEHICC